MAIEASGETAGLIAAAQNVFSRVVDVPPEFVGQLAWPISSAWRPVGDMLSVHNDGDLDRYGYVYNAAKRQLVAVDEVAGQDSTLPATYSPSRFEDLCNDMRGKDRAVRTRTLAKVAIRQNQEASTSLRLTEIQSLMGADARTYMVGLERWLLVAGRKLRFSQHAHFGTAPLAPQPPTTIWSTDGEHHRLVHPDDIAEADLPKLQPPLDANLTVGALRQLLSIV